MSSASLRVTQLLVMVVLARLLAPSAFGMFALANMVVMAISLFRDIGFGQALIYHKTDVQKNAQTTFVMSAVFGFGRVRGRLRGSPRRSHGCSATTALVWPLRVMSVSIVVSSLSVCALAAPGEGAGVPQARDA
jgi:O-antigen/teichoic acid export membrane protein